jgi:hypothetical protein
MMCDYAADTLTCRFCGHIAKRLPTIRECTANQIRLPRVAVGTILESFLTSLGITKERVQSLTRSNSCGCEARKKWLDVQGYALQESAELFLNRLAAFCFAWTPPDRNNAGMASVASDPVPLSDAMLAGALNARRASRGQEESEATV